MTQDEKRLLRVQRIMSEIRSIRINGGGHEYSEVRRLRADKIEIVAGRLADTLRDDYTLLHLARYVRTLTRDRSLVHTPEELRAMQRAANAPDGKPGDDNFSHMSAKQLLDWANAHIPPPKKKTKGEE